MGFWTNYGLCVKDTIQDYVFSKLMTTFLELFTGLMCRKQNMYKIDIQQPLNKLNNLLKLL